MDEFDDEAIISYVLGEASSELAARVQAAAHSDPELAAQVKVLTMSLAVSEPVRHQDNSGPMPPRSVRFVARGKALIAALSLVIVGGFVAMGMWLHAAQTAYAETKDALDQTRAKFEEFKKEKLRDPFDSGWLDPRNWKTGRRKTTAQDGYARLNDRGSLVTVEEFKAPIEISMDWRWVDISGDVSYRDTLTIALHTSGVHSRTHPFEVVDGLLVGFLAHGGKVGLASPTDGSFTVLTNEGEFPMPAGKWHRIRIVDDGKTISVYLSGPAIDKKHHGKPVLRSPYKADFAKHHVALYNREPVAGALHESHIRNVVVRPHREEAVDR